MARSFSFLVCLSSTVGVAWGCSAASSRLDPPGSDGAAIGGAAVGGSPSDPASGTGGSLEDDGLEVDPDEGNEGPDAVLDLSMPADFLPAEAGGLKLGGSVSPDANAPVDSGSARTDPCGAVLTGVVRDFATRGNTEIGHPDFGAGVSNLIRGLVLSDLDAERKPVASSNYAQAFIESPDSFAEWYRDVPGRNLPYYLSLYLEPDADQKVFKFESHDFYPLDGAGFGYEYLEHNYHFTFELHTAFVYEGGEVFGFTGDDDLWVFINGKLAIDLGGVHGEEHEQVELDAVAEQLGLTLGGTYPLDFFQAERWCCGSNFAIETTLTFTNCGEVPVYE